MMMRTKMNTKGGMKGGGMMKTKGYSRGGSLKQATDDQVGLQKLPKTARNKMGYMKAGGMTTKGGMKGGGMMKTKGYSKGGAMNTKGSAKGGKVRGAGIEKKGLRAAKMVTMKRA